MRPKHYAGGGPLSSNVEAVEKPIFHPGMVEKWRGIVRVIWISLTELPAQREPVPARDA